LKGIEPFKIHFKSRSRAHFHFPQHVPFVTLLLSKFLGNKT